MEGYHQFLDSVLASLPNNTWNFHDIEPPVPNCRALSSCSDLYKTQSHMSDRFPTSCKQKNWRKRSEGWGSWEGKVQLTTEIQKMMGSVAKRPNLAGLRSRANSSRRMLAPAVTKSTEAINMGTKSNEPKVKLTR